ncbi:MAG: hypothetical protein GY820_38455 [Gammaproteobacteria bacterium]|nr:hypothetical protein [Gammaproteobacteria bacterium]
MSFKTARANTRNKGIYISITKRHLGLSVAFIREYNLKNCEHANIAYNSETRQLRITFVTTPDEDSFIVRWQLKANSKLITAISVYNQFDINPITHKGKYTPTKHASKNQFTINLSEPVINISPTKPTDKRKHNQ